MLKVTLVTLLVLVIVAAVGVGAYVGIKRVRTDQRQSQLEPFYTAPNPLPAGNPGDLIRNEPLTGKFDVADATAYRILYRTENPDGTARVSSGMAFIPTAPAPPGGRKIISWAHPTVGMGEACALRAAPHPRACSTGCRP